MVKIEKVNRNYENKDGTRNYGANESVCRVCLDGEYIGSVHLTNYSNDSTSRWIVWEWKDASDKDDTFIQHFNCRWFGKFDGLRNSFDCKKDAVEALVARERRLIKHSDYHRELTCGDSSEAYQYDYDVQRKNSE